MDEEKGYYNFLKKTNRISGFVLLLVFILIIYLLKTTNDGHGEGIVLLAFMPFLVPFLIIAIAIYVPTLIKLDRINKNTINEKTTKVTFSRIIKAIILGIAIFCALFFLLTVIYNLFFH